MMNLFEELRKWGIKSNNLVYHISRTYSKTIDIPKIFLKMLTFLILKILENRNKRVHLKYSVLTSN